MPNYSEYEMSVARAMAAHPDLVCLDAMLTFSKGAWMDAEEIEEDDFTDETYRVEVVRLWLLDYTKSQMLGIKFGKKYEFTVYSESAKFFPRPNDYIVDSFPVTLEDVIQVARVYLSGTPYAQERDQFLFGPTLVSISNIAGGSDNSA